MTVKTTARQPLGRQVVRHRFRAVHERGEFLVGAAVGSGLLAEASERGGADFVIAVSAGRLRLMGTASIACMLPICNANALVASFGPSEFIGRVQVPVFCGACAMTPDSATEIAAAIAELGFDGVMNFPSAVHHSSAVQSVLEASGLGFGKELELLRAARELDLWTVCHARTRDEARRAAAAGVDMIYLVYGWNAGGPRGIASVLTLREAAMLAREVANVVRRENRQTLLVLEGGPIETSEDLLPIYRAAHISGYVGGSTIDRLPIEEAVTNQTLRFKGTPAATRRDRRQDRVLTTFGRSLGLVGRSQRMLDLYQSTREAARRSSEFACLVSGEKGVGRQFIAESLFRLSGCDPKSLMTVDASEMSTQRLLVTLFGRHELADQGRAIPGAVARADVSGLIVRGLERISAPTQRRIARALARGSFRAVGGRREELSTLRWIFISVKDMRALTEAGALHPELRSELESREIAVPALREYVEDIDEIIADMARRVAPAAGATLRLSPAALRRLQVHTWPGNLTELRAFVTRLAASRRAEWVDEATAAEVLRTSEIYPSHAGSERDLILDALWRHGFHRGRTAQFLGISRKTLFNKVQRYGLRG